MSSSILQVPAPKPAKLNPAWWSELSVERVVELVHAMVGPINWALFTIGSASPSGMSSAAWDTRPPPSPMRPRSATVYGDRSCEGPAASKPEVRRRTIHCILQAPEIFDMTEVDGGHCDGSNCSHGAHTCLPDGPEQK
eukprot:NODE_22441_length_708_cov_2.748709.p1 GENE.NODE_22441_length_708_cov_2.748709~~NODE_22441_length_708_cov_2.748709.p1  ORF type:complete len:138 (+),score=28.23 NODE_22441_length_708_cov_2.748709:188-601(+)